MNNLGQTISYLVIYFVIYWMASMNRRRRAEMIKAACGKDKYDPLARQRQDDDKQYLYGWLAGAAFLVFGNLAYPRLFGGIFFLFYPGAIWLVVYKTLALYYKFSALGDIGRDILSRLLPFRKAPVVTRRRGSGKKVDALSVPDVIDERAFEREEKHGGA